VISFSRNFSPFSGKLFDLSYAGILRFLTAKFICRLKLFFQFHSDIPSIASLKNFLVGQVKPWLQEFTGIDDLNDTVDMFCAKYAHTDHLLCHDDKLEGNLVCAILTFPNKK